MNSVENFEVYIVCHDKQSYELFKENNKHINISKFKFILVGEYDFVSEQFNDNNIVASFLPVNIEKYNSLLTYTAWFALSKNEIVKSSHVAIFEYDCIFKEDIFKVKKNKNSIIGFNPRITNEKLYLDLIPEFTNLLSKREIEIAKLYDYWNATTNVIIPIWFLDYFVSWYFKFIPDILQFKKHSHFHERSYNILAANMDMDYKFYPDYIEHKQLCSHNIQLQK